jgi:hypothetical protein
LAISLAYPSEQGGGVIFSFGSYRKGGGGRHRVGETYGTNNLTICLQITVLQVFLFHYLCRCISGHCDGAVAGGRLELRPPVESSDLDEKVLTTTPVRDTSPLIIWVDS